MPSSGASRDRCPAERITRVGGQAVQHPRATRVSDRRMKSVLVMNSSRSLKVSLASPATYGPVREALLAGGGSR